MNLKESIYICAKENKLGQMGFQESFIDTIIKQNKVFSLTLDEGFAMTLSNAFVDDDDNQMELFCFWSDLKMAQKSIKDEWEDYQISTISLSTFLEDWCIGLSNENYVIGLDFDEKLVGVEGDSLELLIDISKILIDKSIEVNFEKFKSVQEILDYAEKAIEYQD